jgi:hypothetical protein
VRIVNPFKQSTVFTAAEQSRIDQLHHSFIRKLEKLPEAQRNALIRTTAAGMELVRNRPDGGQDRFAPDTYTRALAQQMLEVIQANERIKAAQDEIATINAKRPDERAALLARREELQESVQKDMIRVLAVREQDLSSAREEAMLDFRKAEAEAAKGKAVLEAVDRLRAEAATDDVERRARAIVNAGATAPSDRDA